MENLPQHDAFAAARHVLEPLADWHPEIGDLPHERDAGDWPTWLDRAAASSETWSTGEKVLLEIGTGLWTERLEIVQKLAGLDEENRARALRALVALSGMTGELSGGQVVNGRFGPQFTTGERVVMSEALKLLSAIVDSVNDSDVFPRKFELAGRDMLDEFAARLVS